MAEFEDVEALLKEYSSIYQGYQYLETADRPSNSVDFQVSVFSCSKATVI